MTACTFSSAVAVKGGLLRLFLVPNPAAGKTEKNDREFDIDDSDSDDSDSDQELEKLFADGLSELLHEEL